MATGEELADDVRVDEVDGVPLMWRPVEGVPFTAGLMLRVGRADESLPQAGVSHLLEHLALFEVGREHPDLRFNGQVDATTIAFHVEGTPEQAVAFVRDVCTKLHALPGDRLDTERDILRAESSRHAMSGAPPALLRWRFGARGFALPAYDEYGLNQLSLEDLHAWASRFATKGNAIVWLTGEPPADLSVPLPDGPRIPAPDLTDVLPQFPCWFNDGPATVAAAAAVMTRTAAGPALRAVLERRLVQRVRYELGATYSPVVQYDGLHPTKAILTMLAEPVPGQEEAVAREVLTALSAVADGDVPQSALDAYRAEFGQVPMRDPNVARGWVAGRAHNELTGARELTLAQYHEELAELDVAAIAEKAAEAASSTLYRLPPDVTPQPGIVAAPVWSSELDGGRRYESRRSDPEWPPAVITVGPAGLSLRDPDGNAASVRTQDAEVLLVWDHDQRSLIGADAVNLDISPAWWQNGLELVRDLDALVPPERHVRMRDKLDPPEGPVGVGEPAVSWLLFVAAFTVLLTVLTVTIFRPEAVTVLPIIVFGVASAKTLRTLQRARRARGLPYSGWPK
jgi:zinc protease